MSSAPAPQHVNELVVVGRVAGTPEPRTLPSGDEIVTLRVVVDRPPHRRRREGRPDVTVDTFEVACWTARLRARALALAPGDVCRVEGSLRRRFYRSAAGPLSRYEIHADRLRREWRAPAARARGAAGSRAARDAVVAPAESPGTPGPSSGIAPTLDDPLRG